MARLATKANESLCRLRFVVWPSIMPAWAAEAFRGFRMACGAVLEATSLRLTLIMLSCFTTRPWGRLFPIALEPNRKPRPFAPLAGRGFGVRGWGKGVSDRFLVWIRR